jgi:hypothetical protein
VRSCRLTTDTQDPRIPLKEVLPDTLGPTARLSRTAVKYSGSSSSRRNTEVPADGQVQLVGGDGIHGDRVCAQLVIAAYETNLAHARRPDAGDLRCDPIRMMSTARESESM